ncbi:unnamed protein product [Paramecium primaurelia]|uniref:Arrestin-like N-terminal domain-containing protein n=1 Tax=Paramecium primaurelia TaxID=5886 RepID=A0A8S1JQR2_PARPR|nr:unnamed protein product [Paramecium primaurelia]
MKSEYILQIKFDKANNTFKPGDFISGGVTVVFTDPTMKRLEIQQFIWKSEGTIISQNKETHKDLERMSSQLHPVLLHQLDGQLTKDKYILQEKNTFPFKYQLTPYQDRKILETYVGVYVAIQYSIETELTLSNGLKVTSTIPYFVYVPGQGSDRIKPTDKYPRVEHFLITPDKLLGNSSTMNKSQNAKFRINGLIDTSICQFQEDFHGSLIIEECDSEIRTIDLQLIRVEKLENNLGKISEATEIQLIQIVEGNATRGLEIPFHMIFPKFFSCPNFQFREFSVDFEVNLVMILYDGFKVTLNFPINIIRK